MLEQVVELARRCSSIRTRLIIVMYARKCLAPRGEPQPRVPPRRPSRCGVLVRRRWTIFRGRCTSISPGRFATAAAAAAWSARAVQRSAWCEAAICAPHLPSVKIVCVHIFVLPYVRLTNTTSQALCVIASTKALARAGCETAQRSVAGKSLSEAHQAKRVRSCTAAAPLSNECAVVHASCRGSTRGASSARRLEREVQYRAAGPATHLYARCTASAFVPMHSPPPTDSPPVHKASSSWSFSAQHQRSHSRSSSQL